MKINVEEILREEQITHANTQRKIRIPKDRELELRKIFGRYYAKPIRTQIEKHLFPLTEETPESESKLRLGPMLEKIMDHGFMLGKYRKHANLGELERRAPKRGRREHDQFEVRGNDIVRFNEVVRSPYKNAIRRVFSDAAESSYKKEETIPHIKEIARRAFLQGYRQGIRERK
ncbi:hypothetical protein HY989_02865 [Candidatus Micrarchaeota archaeon]|nr:hypothetical protein [Candidatus Micrarchaeota archaeon]